MDIRTDPWGRFRLLSIAFTSMSLVLGCAAEKEAEGSEPASWSVTAWGERYEVFPEVDPLIAGVTAPAHTHVTVLDGFSPLVDGTVEIILRGTASEEIFGASEVARPGIFNIEVTPAAAGEYELFFRIRSSAGDEEIRGGRVRVGDREAPGGMVRAPAPRGATDGGEPQSFLKEQQWRTAFATDWVRRGAMKLGARGFARVRPPAGGEAILTATVDGVVQSNPWPYPGQKVRSGATLFRVAPRVQSDRSLSALAAEAAGLEAQTQAASARLARLDGLLAVEATSRREVEDARARLTTLEARLQAARRDLEGATAAREGRGDDAAHALRAPFTGTIVSVTASPGAAIAAGESLARIVRSGPVWVELSLAPDDAARLELEGVSGLVLDAASRMPRQVEADAVRLVALAPEADAVTGRVVALLEVDDAALLLGATLEAEVMLASEREGIVVPATALIDDGGVSVVYLQQSGERFSRQEVEVTARQGDRALVVGLDPGQRVVTLGGTAIRRAGLLSSGPPQGHVH